MSLPYYYFHRPTAAPYTPPAPGSSFADAVLALSPTRYYRLGEPSGTTAVDETGTQNASYENTPTLGVSGITTDGDTGITLASASTQYVTATDHADYDVGTNDWSLMLGLYYPSAWPTLNEFLVIRDGFNTGAWGFYVVGGTNGLYRAYMSGSDYNLTTGATGGYGAWRFLGLSVDRSGNATLYIDGSSVATANVSGQVATDLQRTAPLYIGRYSGAGNYLNGSVDEVAFWNGYLMTGSDWSTLQGAR
jgi:hypothetical protein